VFVFLFDCDIVVPMRFSSFALRAFKVAAWLAVFGVPINFACAEPMKFKFTGMGTHGSLAWGSFTVDGPLQPNTFCPGTCYQSFSLTVSNVPGPSPGTCFFTKVEMEIHSQFTVDSNGVPSILPIGEHSYGQTGNRSIVTGGEEENQSIIQYNLAYCDTINWSSLTLASPPTAPTLTSELTPPDLTLHWPVSDDVFGVESTTDLTPPVNWTAVTGQVTSTNGIFSMAVPLEAAANRFFRLKWPGQ
jgi:hypothetical protein